ncbi:hypothetical protein J8F10_22720 [Gemmata sp. G18]|uniref:RNA polymerase sigma-70 region 2 domain-containing protein n=1 Tax=Gemmata palustris TaxID=2822762 RepID=A0ABS5BXE7_9BACT|nr:hypothetical protein [Gemmata palustris]MBP3958077.1 hypothetical protein [Gemmata palustris]
MTTESDRLLINRVRKNDQSAWAELDKRYRGRLTAYVRRRLQGPRLRGGRGAGDVHRVQ